jgi:Fe-S cluster assembly protein SufD
MSMIADRQAGLAGQYGQLKGLLASTGPEHLVARRESALARYEAKGLPGHKDEEFKYISFRDVAETAYGLPYGANLDRAQLAKFPFANLDAITLVFVNGQFAPELSSDDSLPDGVFVGTLADGFEAQHELVEQHLGRIATFAGKLGSTNDERFVDLNTAFLGEGAFVHVPRGVVLERPVHVIWVNQADHGPFALFPRTLVVVEENAQARFYESTLGRTGASFCNAVTEISIGKGALVEHVKFQDETIGATHLATIAYHQEANSTLTSTNLNFGAKIARNELNVWLNGEHTETWLNGVNLGSGDQVVDTHTRIDHAKPNCNSFEVYKSVLGGQATGIFNGKIFVYEDAQKTDAKQTNQAVLLSPNATMDTKPQLEIFADDVKCTHGATIGRLSEESLFYLRSRGIPAHEARSLLIYAFAAEVLEKVTVPEARTALEKLLFERLGTSRDE